MSSQGGHDEDTKGHQARRPLVPLEEDFSDQDSDLEASLLDPDDPHTFGLHHEHPEAEPQYPRHRYRGDPQKGLISPYKRLRVDDSSLDNASAAGSTSMDSQGGEGEAHSLIRSLDSVSSHHPHRSLMSTMEDCYSSLTDDTGSFCSQENIRGDINTNTNSSNDTSKDTFGTRSVSSRYPKHLAKDSRRNHIPPTNYELCLKEDDPYVSADEKEFPGPPRLDKSKGHRSALSTDLEHVSADSSESGSCPQPPLESSTMYHPDYQVLESKNISYHPVLELSKDVENRNGSKVSVSSTLKSKRNDVAGSSSALPRDLSTGDGEISKQSMPPASNSAEIFEIHDTSANLSSAPSSQSSTSKIVLNPKISLEVVMDDDDIKSKCSSSSSHPPTPLYQNMLQPLSESDSSSPMFQGQTIDEYFRSKSGIWLNDKTRLGAFPKLGSFESELQVDQNAMATYVEMSPCVGVVTNAAPPPPPSSSAAAASSISAPSPTYSHDGSGSRIYEILDSDSSDLRSVDAVGRDEIKTTVSSGVSTDDLKSSYTACLDLMHDDCIVSGAAQELAPVSSQHQYHLQYSGNSNSHSHSDNHYFSAASRLGSTRSSSRTTLGSAGMMSSQSDSSARNSRGRRDNDLPTDQRHRRIHHSSESQGSQHSGATTSSSRYHTTASSSSQDYCGDVTDERSFPSSLAISSRKARKAVLQSSGLLKVAAYMNVGLLTVNIIKARHLSSAWSQHCDAYVKMSLVPDETRRTRCKTKQIPSTNSPIFEEKFSIEILDEDRRKRLLISVWHKDENNG